MKSDEERSLPLLFKAALQQGQVTGKLISFVKTQGIATIPAGDSHGPVISSTGRGMQHPAECLRV